MLHAGRFAQQQSFHCVVDVDRSLARKPKAQWRVRKHAVAICRRTLCLELSLFWLGCNSWGSELAGWIADLGLASPVAERLAFELIEELRIESVHELRQMFESEQELKAIVVPEQPAVAQTVRRRWW